MDCLLFRHGLAVDWSDWSGDDRSRPLTDEGMANTRHAAQGLVRLGVIPTRLLCSPWLRTRQTAGVVRDILKIPDDPQLCTALLSDASPDDFLAMLTAFAHDDCVCCVGHEPHLGHAAGVMLSGQPVAGLSFKPSGACLIRFDGKPRHGNGTLQWWLPPAPGP